jgi:hypothetical protein
VHNSPLGHQLKSLTSDFSQVLIGLARYPLVRGVGVHDPLGHAVPAHAGPARLLLGGSVSYELFYHLGRFAGIFVLPDPGCDPAHRGELGVGVAVAVGAGDATELQTPPAAVLVLGRWLCSG